MIPPWYLSTFSALVKVDMMKFSVKLSSKKKKKKKKKKNADEDFQILKVSENENVVIS
jgi:hypothetical protein